LISSILLEAIQGLLEAVIEDSVSKDVPKYGFPIVENQTAPMLAKIVEPINLDPLLFCPAVLNVSLTNPYVTSSTCRMPRVPILCYP
jgi:hypothetical protein